MTMPITRAQVRPEKMPIPAATASAPSVAWVTPQTV